VLRGIRLDEVGAIGEALTTAGVHSLGVALNTSDAFETITQV
jgi:2-keto-3-deoxy-6-phosphogluconate aldolase